MLLNNVTLLEAGDTLSLVVMVDSLLVVTDPLQLLGDPSIVNG